MHIIEYECLDQVAQLAIRSVSFVREWRGDEKGVEGNEETDGTISIGGQSCSLMNLICDAEIPSDAPICKECSDQLLVDMDQQLKLLEDDCAAYRQLIDYLKEKHSSADIASYKQTLRNLKAEESALKAQFDQLCTEEARLDAELMEKKAALEEKTEEEASRWRHFRDNHRRLLDIDEKSRNADAELRYAAEQHRRLASCNALDLVFNIWVDPADGIIGEINGFRLGRLPDRLVDWPEINGAWGQLVLLLDVLMQRAGVKRDNFKLITMCSHSCIQYKRSTGEEVRYPLFASGSWKPFGNNNMDSGIVAYLQCFELLRTTLQKQNPSFEIPHRIVNKDCLVYGTMEYSAKMLLNKEERWTKAMKLLLTNLRAAMMPGSGRSRRRGRVRRSSSSSSCNSCDGDDRHVAARVLRAAIAANSSKRVLKEQHDDLGEAIRRLTTPTGAAYAACDLYTNTDTRVSLNVNGVMRQRQDSGWFPSFWFFALASSLVLAPVSITGKGSFDIFIDSDISSIMYGNLAELDDVGFVKARPIGVRWRDEATLARIAYNYTERMDFEEATLMPLVTERPRSHLVRGPGQLVPTTSAAPPAPSQDDPSLEDLELIDVLWRNDIAAEKGTRQLQPADQYELDLQLLTEKSVHAPLSAEESSRFEDLSKVYFEDFYAVPYVLRPGSKGLPQPASRSDHLFGIEDDHSAKREVPTPTDEDLAELLEDVSKEGGQLDRLTCGGAACAPPDLEPLPLVNNVSLSDGIVFTPQNVSEMSMMHEQRQAAITSILTPPAPATLYNETSMPNVWMQQAQITPNDIYPNNGYMSFQNDTGVPVVSTGSQYDHQYHTNLAGNHLDEHRLGRSAPMYDPYYSARTTSFSNETSSVCSSTSTAASPHFHNETENYSPHASRYYGKLAPKEVDGTNIYARSVCGLKGDNNTTVASSLSNMPRRRGRQSKDEQLAAANRLPLSAREISEMTLGELHKVLKNESLTEHQKQLIRKIRRRGKNKVAARTCRERRGERQRSNSRVETSWNVPVSVL
ncbi:hypothetical protein GCK32_008498, partial [Trichostrongylus colubriformis]